MICAKYENLIPIERSKMIGEVVHALMSDDSLFDMALELIDLGKRKGVFDDVTILPEDSSPQIDQP